MSDVTTNKIMKFRPYLKPLVLSGEKTVTWRLFDDKNLSQGDTVDFYDWISGEQFATAQLTKVWEKAFKDLTPQDWEGHEKIKTHDEMYARYVAYYKRPVGPDTVVKIIAFEILKKV